MPGFLFQALSGFVIEERLEIGSLCDGGMYRMILALLTKLQQPQAAILPDGSLSYGILQRRMLHVV
jgi:hypothetical protein